jgi:hypothetical protein
MAVDLAGMRAICVLYVPGTRSSGGMVMKKIGVTFVPGARARTLRNQRESWLRVLLFDALASTSATISTTTMLVLLLMHTMRSGRISGRIRVGVSR